MVSAVQFKVIIPARYQSSRFPGKPLADINGKPMIQHVVERALEAGAQEIVVATDDARIAKVAEAFSQVVMTSTMHTSGTERLAEVIKKQHITNDTIIVNVQGDEPFIPAENIKQVAHNLAKNPTMQMSTLCTPIESEEDVFNPNIVKVVTSNAGRALYFSRAVIPFSRNTMMQEVKSANPQDYYRHIGLYAYKAQYIQRYVEYPASSIEQLESLEQLRALWYGDAIHVDIARAKPPVGIDTPEDLQALMSYLSTIETGSHSL